MGFVERIFFDTDDKAKRKAFEEFLGQKYCGEIACFLTAVAEYRRRPRKADAQRIYKRFIEQPDLNDHASPFGDGSESDTLNLSNAAIDLVRTKLLAPDAHCFDEVVDEMARLIRANGFEREFLDLEQLVVQYNAMWAAKMLAIALLLASVGGMALAFLQ